MSLNQPVGIPHQNPRDYVGPEQNIIPIKRFPREPTTSDKRYRIGQVAIIGKNPITGTEGELWYLARFEANGDATWLQFDTGTPGVGIDALLTDDGAPAVRPNVSGIVGLLGGVGITTSGQDPATDVSIAIDSSVVGQTITGDAGGALSPTAGNWDILGGNGTVSSGAGSTLTVEMQSPFVGDFSFESNTGGATETFTVQNTVDAALSGAVIQALVAGSASTSNPTVQVASTAQRAAGFLIDTTSGNINFDRSISGSVTLSETVFKIDGADATARVLFEGPGGVAISSGNPAGGTTLLHVINSNSAADSDVELLLQSGDPTVGAGGGTQSIRWGSPGQVQFSLGQGKDLTAATQPLEIQQAGFVSGAGALLQLHPGGNLNLDGTGAFTVQRGTTGERPGTPVNGMIRYNTTTAKFEGYEAGAWANLI